MPFVHVKVAAEHPSPEHTTAIQSGITALMASVLGKDASLTAVLVERMAPGAWSIGGRPVALAAQVDAIVSAGTNSPAQKARFVAEAMVLLRRVLGPGLHDVSYVVVHDLPRDSWGYGGLTQAARAAQAEAVSPAAAA